MLRLLSTLNTCKVAKSRGLSVEAAASAYAELPGVTTPI